MHLFVKGLKGLVQDVLENAKDLPRMRNSICKIKDVLRYVCESHYFLYLLYPLLLHHYRMYSTRMYTALYMYYTPYIIHLTHASNHP